MAEKIPIGADHAGFKLKERLKVELKKLGYEPVDVGAKSEESSDYADFAKPVAEDVSTGKVKRGVLTCGTGLGMGYTANRYPHVRAAVVWSPEIAELSRHHNDSNILVLPSRFMSEDEAVETLKRWLNTPYDGGRHDRRIEKIEREA
jgi:ribose 5-phosphate isomerase B